MTNAPLAPLHGAVPEPTTDSVLGRKQLRIARYFSYVPPTWRKTILAVRMLSLPFFGCGALGVLGAIVQLITKPRELLEMLVALAFFTAPGVLLLRLAAWLDQYVKRLNKRDTNAEPIIDAQVEALRLEFSKRGLSIMGLNRDIGRVDDQTVVASPLSWCHGVASGTSRALNVEDAGQRAVAIRGCDGHVRYSHWCLEMNCLTPHHLGCYHCTFDVATASIIAETSKEYHYKDVVSLEEYGIPIIISAEKYIAYKLQIKMSDSSDLTLFIGSFHDSDVHEFTQTLRVLLREHRASIVRIR